MRRSKALAKIRAGKPVKLAMLGHFIPGFVAHAAHLGYDAIWLDLEHRPMDNREVQALLAFFHLYDIDCIIRPPTREKGQLYRYLEDGATGLIIPLVETAAEARELVSKVKFPPLGDRGLEGRGLDGNFGAETADPDAKASFTEQANRETILVIQMESPSGVLNAGEIAAVEGVDVVFVGPTDFDIRARQYPEDQRMSWEEALERLAHAAKSTGKAWGVMPRVIEHVKNVHSMGAQFVPYGIDLNLIIAGLKKASAELDEVFGS
jgi:2-keto-3-deoxy-L-rhamnonate aldolase RhmA